MKKTRILALVLVASLMMTGGAYALWNQNVALTTSAAMGEMDLTLTCDHDIYPLSFMPGIEAFGPWTYKDMEPYMNPLTGTVTADRQSIDVKVGNLYPGAKYGLDYEIKNTGDVPFKLQGVTITYTGDNYNLFTKLTGSFQFYYQKANGERKLIAVGASALTSEGLGAAIVAACKDIIVYPGDQLIGCYADQNEVTTFMQISVDDKIKGDELENEKTSFKIDFNWEQCTPNYIA